MTFGEPLVQTVLPVVTWTQALVIDDDLDPVAVDLHQLLADRLQELPVRLCLRVARLAGAPARRRELWLMKILRAAMIRF